MAAAKRKTTNKRKRGGRKLEFAIYIAGVLLICLLVLGIVKGIRAFTGKGDGGPSGPASSTTAAPSSLPANAGLTSNVSAMDGSTASLSSKTSTGSSASATSSQTASSKVSSTASSNSTGGKQNGDYVSSSKTGAAELEEWYLFLVNPDKTISSDWMADMTYLDSEYRLDSRIIRPYKDMVAAAAADGVSLYPVSCYRSYETQTRLYNNRVERSKSENPSFTQQQAEAHAATHVARPGTSEHQTGLAIDFNSVETDFGSTKAGKWLKAHANEYGFILRYEKDKQSLTGVTWEPWHYRFVGVKHAKRMTELGYCLEEYVDYIKAGGQ